MGAFTGIVGRHLALEFLGASSGVLVVLFTLWLSADSLLHVDEIASGGSTAFRNVLLRSLDILPQGIPTACAIGAVLALSRAMRAREITAIRCGGIKLRAVLLPTVALSLGIAVALGFVHDRALVPAHRELAGLAERDRDDRPVEVAGRWWYVSGDWLFSAAEFSARARELRGVTAFHLGPQRSIVRRLDSERAVFLGEGRWEFFTVTDRTFPDAANMVAQQLERLQLSLGVSLAPSLLRTETGLPVPEAMSLHRLADAVQEATIPAERLTLETTYHGRMALPLAVVALVLLAVPAALREGDGHDSLPRALLRCLLAIAGFWALWGVAQIGPLAPTVPAAVSIWGMMAFILAIGVWQFGTIRE